MNISILIGRLTAKPELKATPNKVYVSSFTIAVERKFKGANGEKIVDYIDCVAWRNQAEFLCKWFDKGVRVAVAGELQTRVYEDKDGKKRKAVEVICTEVNFADGKREATESNDNMGIGADDDFTPISDDDALPF